MKAIENNRAMLNNALQPVGFCILIDLFYIGLIACAYIIIAPILLQAYEHFTVSLDGLKHTLTEIKF